ncbi:hypothetical protein NDU88_000131 [Pleurodeles waltl]|uniref:Uncharacterized protein n=1 Tax=Pleurodeles waltl TaxID=8319 RepID=A0AAV7UPW9_PLEWA|nr:hypothetical protein NDU88_000131 [Pleurodeles waltl]
MCLPDCTENKDKQKRGRGDAATPSIGALAQPWCAEVPQFRSWHLQALLHLWDKARHLQPDPCVHIYWSVRRSQHLFLFQL